jgi:hypothetical protein
MKEMAMPNEARRRFVALLGAAATGLGSSKTAEPQAPARVSMDHVGERRRRLGAALRELNEAAGLGVTDEDFERTEAYATGALLEAEAKLRPLVLDERLDLPVVFTARRRP